MKLSESLNLIDKRWVKKRKGYRVQFQTLVKGEVITDYVPSLEEKLLDSDIVAWRLAWKLARCKMDDEAETIDQDPFNIYVVDDEGNQINYYATNKPTVFKPRDISTHR